MYAAQSDAVCENMFTRAADTALSLTELELAEHQVIEIGDSAGCDNNTVNNAYVPHTSMEAIFVPFQYRSGSKHEMTQTGVIAIVNAL